MNSILSIWHWSLVKVLVNVMLVVMLTIGMNAQKIFDVVHYDVKDGLSHTHVTSVLEHSSGFVWVGSKDGLDMYNGYEFYKMNLPHHPSLMYGSLGPFIYSMKELDDGKIYIDFLQHANYQSKIVYIFDPFTSTTEVIDTTSHRSFNFKECNEQALYQDSPDFEFLSSDCHGNSIVKEISTSSIYLMYSDGNQLELSDDFINEDFQIGFMGDDFSKIIYAKSTNGFLKIVPSNTPFEKFLNEDINDWEFGRRARAICPINSSEILVSLEDDNLKRVNLESRKIEDIAFRDINTDTLISTNYLTGIIKESDSIYYATALEFFFLKLNINTLKAEYILDGGRFITYLQHHSIQLKNGNILLAGGYENTFGLFNYSPKTGSVENFQIGRPHIESTVHSSYLLEGKDGTIWLGTDYGLLHLNFDKKEILCNYVSKDHTPIQRTIDTQPVLNGKGVYSLFEDDNGNIWVGLDRGGLDILNPITNTIKSYTTENGLSGNSIAGIIEQDGRYWVSTFTGLSLIDTANQTIINFDKNDGLTHQEFNRLSFTKTSDDKMVFGGMNGINCFDPSEILNKNDSVTIHLSQIEYYKADGKSLVKEVWPFKDDLSISVPASNKTCAFNFFLSDFATSALSTYEYKLVNKYGFGYRDSGVWKRNGSSNEVRFNYLESGDYILFVRGKTRDGIVSNTYALDLKVHDYFYNRPWFILMIMTLVLGIANLLYRMKLNQIKDIENIRTKLSSDLHDNVGSLLSGVAYQMELLEYSVNEKDVPLVQRVAKSSRRAMSEMRNIVWALDSRNSNYQNLADRFRDHAEEMLTPFDVVFSLKLDKVLETKQVDSKKKHELHSIFQEFIANTLKHSEASEVKVNLVLKGTKVLFSLKDNGKGIDETSLNTSGQGLRNMEMRIRSINGIINFTSQSGLLIEIEFPLW